MAGTSAITFENVSKHYRGAVSYKALRDDLVAGLGRVVGRRGPSRLPIKAVDDISFDIKVGESFALVGMNGAGKTTALKLATRISYPTFGRVRVRGRVGALIEVGTGMHPELTGRENIRLYGRILGLSGRQVASRFDQIVEFAGIADAIDRPVKQYSSGMTLRIGFSVAAHLEPDVLLVDEAIAVGDAAFQIRCVERMRDLVREGRTLVFVSHDMSAVETLCQRAVLLDGGRIANEGPARDVVRQHLLNVQTQRMETDERAAIDGRRLTIKTVQLFDSDGNEATEFKSGDSMTVRMHYHATERVPSPHFSVGIIDGRMGALTEATMLRDGETPPYISGDGWVDCRFRELRLLPRTYEVWGAVKHESGWGPLVQWQRLRLFRVVSTGEHVGLGGVTYELAKAPVIIPYEWGFSERQG